MNATEIDSPHSALTFTQKILIGMAVGALIGAVSVFAQDRLSRHYIRVNGQRKLSAK